MPRLVSSLLIALIGAALIDLITRSVLAGGITAVAVLIAASLPRGRRHDEEHVKSRRDPDADGPGAIVGVPDPVLVLTGTRVARANPAARALLGEHIVDQDVRLAIRHPAAIEALIGTAADPASRPVEVVGLGTLGQPWRLRVTDLPEGRRVVHLADLSQSRAAERVRVDFVANASHELNTPLAAVLGFVETLKDDDAGGDAATRHRFLDVILGEARRMQRLIADLMSLSRIEADKHRLPRDPIDLGALAAEVAAEIAARRQRSYDLRLALAPDLPLVAGDRAQLSQLIHNLVDNAFKYGRTDGEVTLSLERQDEDTVCLSVSDQGEGIAPQHLPRLTERFYRADAGRSRAMGGTGLGLAIVKHIVERHRGRLSITSTPGQGTTVFVALPVATVIKT